MTEDQGESLGEIGRSMKRLEAAFAVHQTESRARFHEIANRMNEALAPISVHTIQIENQQKAISRIDEDVRAVDQRVTTVRVQSAWMSGGITGVGAFVNFLIGRH